MHDLHVELRAMAVVDAMDMISLDGAKVSLKAPSPAISLPPLVAVKQAHAKYAQCGTETRIGLFSESFPSTSSGGILLFFSVPQRYVW